VRGAGTLPGQRPRCRTAGGYTFQHRYLLTKGPGLCRVHAFPALEFWKFLGATAPIFPSRPRRYLSAFFGPIFPKTFLEEPSQFPSCPAKRAVDLPIGSQGHSSA
jgi:hypothetical protein